MTTMNKTKIEIPSGWVQVAQMPISQDEKKRVYRGINDGIIPSLKLNGGKFAPVYAPASIANDYLSGGLIPESRADKVAKILEQITSGVSENSRISSELGIPSGSVSNYVRKLAAEGKVIIRDRRYYLASKEPSKPVQDGPFQMSQDVGGLSLSLTNLEQAIDELASEQRADSAAILAEQKETNRLLAEILKVWKS